MPQKNEDPDVVPFERFTVPQTSRDFFTGPPRKEQEHKTSQSYKDLVKKTGKYAPAVLGNVGAWAGTPFGPIGRGIGGATGAAIGDMYRQSGDEETPMDWETTAKEAAIYGGSEAIIPGMKYLKYIPGFKKINQIGEIIDAVHGMTGAGRAAETAGRMTDEEIINEAVRRSTAGRRAAQGAEAVEENLPHGYARGGGRPSPTVERPPSPGAGPARAGGPQPAQGSKVTGSASQPGAPPEYGPPYGGELGAPQGAGELATRPQLGRSRIERYRRRNQPDFAQSTERIHGGAAPEVGSVVEREGTEISRIGTGNSQSAGNLTRSAEVPAGRETPFEGLGGQQQLPPGAGPLATSMPGRGYQTGFGGAQPPSGGGGRTIPLGGVLNYGRDLLKKKALTDMIPGLAVRTGIGGLESYLR